MNARKGNITVEPYTRSVRTVQREGRKSLNFPSTLSYTLIYLLLQLFIRLSRSHPVCLQGSALPTYGGPCRQH